MCVCVDVYGVNEYIWLRMNVYDYTYSFTPYTTIYTHTPYTPHECVLYICACACGCACGSLFYFV